MRYQYLNWIISDSDLHVFDKYPLIKTNRIDKQSIREYRQFDNNLIIYADKINHSIEYQNLLNQSNERNIKMISLKDKLNNLKKTETISLKDKLNKGNSLASKLQNKKGIVQEQSELTIEKFNRIESMEKTLNNMVNSLETFDSDIDLIQSDMVKLVNSLNQVNKNVLENNALLVTIAKQLNGISSIQSVQVKNKKEKPETTKEHINIETNTDSELIESIYKVFMNIYKGKFCGSKKLDKLIEFNELIQNLDMDSPETIDSSIRQYWTNKREQEQVFIFAPKAMKPFINAMIDTINTIEGNEKPLTNTKVNSPVKNKEWYAEKFAIDMEHMNEIVDYFKTNTINEIDDKTILEYIIEVSQKTWTIQNLETLIDYLKGYCKK